MQLGHTYYGCGGIGRVQLMPVALDVVEEKKKKKLMLAVRRFIVYTYTLYIGQSKLKSINIQHS